MVDALKRASAKRITVVTPFFGYARQDKKHRGREPISARLMADLFKHRGRRPADGRRSAHRPDPGLLRRPGRPPVRAADPGRLRRRPVRRSQQVDRGLAGCGPGPGLPSAGPTGSAARSRSSTSAAIPTSPNEVAVLEVVGDVAGRTCIIVDDMIDTGGTICKAAEALFDQGAARSIVAATHGVLSGAAVDRAEELAGSARSSSPTPCRSRRRSGSTSSPCSRSRRSSRGRSSEVFSDGSVTSLFEGRT